MNIEKEGLFIKIRVALSIMLYQLIEEKIMWYGSSILAV